MSQPLDATQSAAAAQFNRQSANYGRKHILADTADVSALLAHIPTPHSGRALDVATGGGHNALRLARAGFDLTLTDVSKKMLENAARLLAEEGFACDTHAFPAEEMPFPDATFDLVSSRVAPHHFSSPGAFVRESARVLKPGGWFLLIDGSVPDGQPEVDRWLNQVEQWRDPSHVQLHSREAWETLARDAGLTIRHSELIPRKQPNLDWYFETAATTPENRARVLSAIATAPESVREHLQLREEDATFVWWWPMLSLLARRP